MPFIAFVYIVTTC